MHLNVHLRYLSVTQVKELGGEENVEKIEKELEEEEKELEEHPEEVEELEHEIDELKHRYETPWPVGVQQWAVDAVFECDPDWWKFFCVSCSGAEGKVIINM